MEYSTVINFVLLQKSFFPFISASKISLCIAFFAFLLGISFGSVLAFLLRSKFFFIRLLASAYCMIIRGTPMLLHVMGLFLFLPVFGISLSPITVAIIAIGLNSAAYMSRVIEAGIDGVDGGQWEAGQTLGLNKFQVLRFIIFPQAIKIIFPMIKSEIVTLIKDSSLASIIGVIEISQQGQLIASTTYDIFTAYAGIAISYLVLTLTVSLFCFFLEKGLFYART